MKTKTTPKIMIKSLYNDSPIIYYLSHKHLLLMAYISSFTHLFNEYSINMYHILGIMLASEYIIVLKKGYSHEEIYNSKGCWTDK